MGVSPLPLWGLYGGIPYTRDTFRFSGRLSFDRDINNYRFFFFHMSQDFFYKLGDGFYFGE